MALYIIGDVQGCYKELQALLGLIDYNPDRDQLGFVGDLVNRGADSLHVLRFLKNLRDPLIVLGNHDLYLLILGYQLMSLDAYHHTLDDVINAPDCHDLLDWLRHQSVLIHDKNALLVHAGIPPQWNISESLSHAKEVEAILQGPRFDFFLKNLFGDKPLAWNNKLEDVERWRYIINALTRMRLCTKTGKLNLIAQLETDLNDPDYKAWFKWRNPKDKTDILFGHWARLGGFCEQPHTYALDTGCAWGETLTAIRLEDKKRFSVSAIV
jgi:bis(5'-nucleosyl)-tetraphosphatase (symmetrical)